MLEVSSLSLPSARWSEKDEAMILNAGLAAVKRSITMMFIDIIQFIITNSCILLQIQTFISSLFNFEGQQSGEKQQNPAGCVFLSCWVFIHQ